MKTIGIIGFGFVGKAVHHGFSLTHNIKVYDKVAWAVYYVQRTGEYKGIGGTWLYPLYL